MRWSKANVVGSFAMRNYLLSVLLATSVAMPAMAQDRDGGQRDRGEQSASSDERQQARAERRAARAERGDNEQRPERAERERPQQMAREEVIEQRQSGDQQAAQRRAYEPQGGERRGWGQRRSNNDGMTAAIERQQQAARAEQGQVVEQQQRDYRRDGRRRDGDSGYVGSRDGSLLGRAMENSRARDGQVVGQHYRDDRSRSRYSGSNRQWSNHWRGDRNYDWRNHRNRNRSIFRLGNYWDPYGSSYRRFSIGFSLFPNYYRSNNWLNDPWMYRLPPAYGPYRWVRYYDDALLVNVYTGQVVDVEYNFFW